MKDKPMLAGFVGAAIFAGTLFVAYAIYANIKKTGKPAYVGSAKSEKDVSIEPMEKK